MTDKKRGFGAFAATEKEQTALREQRAGNPGAATPGAATAPAEPRPEAPRLAPKPVSATEPTAPKLVK